MNSNNKTNDFIFVKFSNTKTTNNLTRKKIDRISSATWFNKYPKVWFITQNLISRLRYYNIRFNNKGIPEIKILINMFDLCKYNFRVMHGRASIVKTLAHSKVDQVSLAQYFSSHYLPPINEASHLPNTHHPHPHSYKSNI